MQLGPVKAVADIPHSFAMLFRAGVVASLLAVAQAATSTSSASAQATSACRCFPGDACWPSTTTWAQFNQSVDGQLIKTVPLGTPCHVPDYNAGVCSTLKAGWMLPEEQYVGS